eukprot:CAMPEP_0173467376 /NCGR_PEP_ID=MMETSP1357-20121228/74957_1 /TAXON_ID=77926 /ORGANISM="Hemiselmis rufescens, Strain PCC563" /LENGTH=80 /DNA_ID=CAMNT_0014435509 /DNA_START=358 /DNA_END=596 /DNA_ORIENTATION=-
MDATPLRLPPRPRRGRGGEDRAGPPSNRRRTPPRQIGEKVRLREQRRGGHKGGVDPAEVPEHPRQALDPLAGAHHRHAHP